VEWNSPLILLPTPEEHAGRHSRNLKLTTRGRGGTAQSLRLPDFSASGPGALAAWRCTLLAQTAGSLPGSGLSGTQE
jgi:hypothetical protein